MKYTIILITLIVYSFSVYSQENTKDSIYVLIDKSNNKFKMDVNEDSIRSSFSILKYRFRTKKLRDDYFQKIKETFEPQTSFSLNFYSYKKPIKKKINFEIFFSIDELSKDNLKISHRTKFFFVEKLYCNYYMVYEAFLQFEE